MTKNIILSSSLLLAATAVAQGAEGDKPNILLISVDDLNSWAGCLTNHPGVKTPNIDRLAERGVLFTNAHCTAPLSGPSRASIYSGMLPSTSGNYFHITDENIMRSNDVTAQITFLPDYLEQHGGYKTMGVGKLLHGGDEIGVFDEYGTTFFELKYGPFLPNREKVNYDISWFGHKGGTVTDWSPMEMSDEEMHDYQAASWAIEKLDEKHDDPFMLAVGFVRPHVPWYVPQKWFDMFDEEEMVTPPYRADDLDDVPQISRDLHDMPVMPQTEWLIESGKWKGMIKGYLACMAFMDAQVGRVLDALESSEYADNTIIVLFADHGYHLGEKGRTCKHSLWERSTHVPLIFAGDFIESNQLCDAPVSLVDLYPTLADLCGLPANHLNDGHSVKSLIEKPKSRWENGAITSYGKGHTSIYFDDFHYIEYSNGDSELYDMKRDPNEWNNITDEKKYQKIKARLKDMLPKSFANYSTHTLLGTNKFIDSQIKADWEANK